MEKVMQRFKAMEDRYAGLLCYFVLIPFLHPRGFDECWLWYKNFFKLWLYLALVVIAFWVIYDLIARGWRYKMCIFWIAGYHVAFIGITFLTQGGINEGLQKLFAAPAFCVFIMQQLRQDPKMLLRRVVNLLIITLVLDLTAFCMPVASEMIQKFHITFLGHVQVVAQIGLVGLLAGVMLFVCDPAQRERAVIVIGVSLVSMLMVDTVASLLVLLFLAACLVVWQIRPVKRLLLLDSRVYVWGSVAVSVLAMLYALTQLDVRLGKEILALNGRTFVWRHGVELFCQEPILGYGAYGAVIKTFWSEGMNYAHNELLQRLLDGGIGLALLFFAMICGCVKTLNTVHDKKYRAVANALLVSMLLLMQIESVTEYYFVFLFLMILAYLPELLALKEKERTEQEDGSE